jgi:hypothetical protein
LYAASVCGNVRDCWQIDKFPSKSLELWQYLGNILFDSVEIEKIAAKAATN